MAMFAGEQSAESVWEAMEAEEALAAEGAGGSSSSRAMLSHEQWLAEQARIEREGGMLTGEGKFPQYQIYTDGTDNLTTAQMESDMDAIEAGEDIENFYDKYEKVYPKLKFSRSDWHGPASKPVPKYPQDIWGDDMKPWYPNKKSFMEDLHEREWYQNYLKTFGGSPHDIAVRAANFANELYQKYPHEKLNAPRSGSKSRSTSGSRSNSSSTHRTSPTPPRNNGRTGSSNPSRGRPRRSRPKMSGRYVFGPAPPSGWQAAANAASWAARRMGMPPLEPLHEPNKRKRGWWGVGGGGRAKRPRKASTSWRHTNAKRLSNWRQVPGYPNTYLNVPRGRMRSRTHWKPWYKGKKYDRYYRKRERIVY